MRICKYLILHQSFSMYYAGTSLVAQTGKNPPAMLETQVRSLGQEDSLEKGLTTHSSILAWRIPWTEEPGGLSPWSCKESDMTEQLTQCIGSLGAGGDVPWVTLEPPWSFLLEKEMATHSSILAWRVPWTEELGRLQSMSSQSVGHGWATMDTLAIHINVTKAAKVTQILGVVCVPHPAQ